VSNTRQSLAGCRILIVEDEYLIANQLETDVERLRSHRRSPDQHFHSRTVTGYDNRLRTARRCAVIAHPGGASSMSGARFRTQL
jgi:hypothetical protein